MEQGIVFEIDVRLKRICEIVLLEFLHERVEWDQLSQQIALLTFIVVDAFTVPDYLQVQIFYLFKLFGSGFYQRPESLVVETLCLLCLFFVQLTKQIAYFLPFYTQNTLTYFRVHICNFKDEFFEIRDHYVAQYRMAFIVQLIYL